MTRIRILSILTLAALGSAGCLNTCQQLCDESANYADRCLEYWEALWPDLGFENSVDYADKCKARYTHVLGAIGPEDQRAMRLLCADDMASIASSTSCVDYQPSEVLYDPTEGDNGTSPQPQGEGP